MQHSSDNAGIHIQSAIERTSCRKHGVPEGIPCWSISKNVNQGFGRYAAICGKRIRAAGYVGKITPTDLRPKTFTRRTNDK